MPERPATRRRSLSWLAWLTFLVASRAGHAQPATLQVQRATPAPAPGPAAPAPPPASPPPVWGPRPWRTPQPAFATDREAVSRAILAHPSPTREFKDFEAITEQTRQQLLLDRAAGRIGPAELDRQLADYERAQSIIRSLKQDPAIRR